MKKLNAIIIEDEVKSRDTLRHMLNEFCPNVNVIGEAVTVDEGKSLILQNKPDLVFLDIELPNKNGFHLFSHFPKPSFDVVFTTAYDKYAIQAFQIAAVDYLLKPLNLDHLERAIDRVLKKQSNKNFDILTSNFKDQNFKKIALPSSNGYIFLDIENIMLAEASRSYTTIYTKDNEKILISKPLKFLESSLTQLHFFRINRSYIVNMNFLKSYSRTHNGEVTMSNGMVLSLAESKKEAFLNQLKF